MLINTNISKYDSEKKWIKREREETNEKKKKKNSQLWRCRNKNNRQLDDQIEMKK